MKRVYDVNATLINDVLPAASKDEVRYYLRVVHIEDKKGYRTYTATDGHILFSAEEKIGGKSMKQPLDIYIKSPLKMPNKYENRVLMEVVDKDTVVFKGCTSKTVADIVDCHYPDWRRVIEYDDEKKVLATQYALFNPRLMQKAFNFSRAVHEERPFMVDSKSPAQWEEKGKDYSKICVVMPMRYNGEL